MRISLVLLFSVILQLSARDGYAQRTRRSISMSNATIEQVLNQIEKSSDYVFLYNDKTIQADKIVSLHSRSTSIKEMLDHVFEGTNITYTIVDKQIILSTQKAPAAPQQAYLQIKGVVKDNHGEPIIGANVKVKGTTVGSITDLDGNFTLSVPKGALLEVSYIGYTSKEVKVVDTKSLEVILEEDTKVLNEVVVTALGIKKESKALTYNVQELKAADLVTVKDANFMNSLAGKVAGVTINTSSTGVGGSARVVMRGTKSISGNNNALYVVDGIPLASLQTTQPGDMYTGMGQSGDGTSMINPEDIESMSVLSGAAAAALYGSDAANGVIMINTKKGKAGKLSVSVSNSTTFSSPFILPEFQNTYGSNLGEYSSWGAKLDQPSNYDPADFFQTGYNVTNNVSLSTGSEQNQTYFSAGSVSARGIIHNNDLDRYNISFRNSTSLLNNKLHLDLGFMYMNVKEQNMLAQGQYFNPLVPVYLFPRGDDFSKYETFERYNPTRNFKTQYWPYGDQGMQMQNPYWVTERNKFNNDKNRFLINAGLKYDITDWMNISTRVKYDGNFELRSQKFSASTLGLFAGPQGEYRRDNLKAVQMYGDAMLSINKYIGDFSITSTIGASIRDVQYDLSQIGGSLQSVPNLFTFGNLGNLRTLQQEGYHDQTQSLFATAQVGYKSMIYLDLTGRADWASQLAGSKVKVIPYPSVGLSTIWTEIFPIRSNVLSFLKTRLSYSEVGNAPIRFICNPGYDLKGGYPQTTTYLADDDIRPELTKSYEAGLSAKLFNNKLNVELSVYKSSTYNQLFNPSLSSSTGYTSYYVNAGRVDNKGLELTLGLNQNLGPVKWNSNLTYSINRNKIVQLLPETMTPLGTTVSMSEMYVAGTDGYRMILKEGGSMGDIYVNTLKTDEHGYYIVDIVSQKVTADPNHFVKAGNSSPNYTLGWRNNFEFKGLNVGFLINGRFGGVGVSATQAKMDAYGVSKASADARDNGGALVNGERIPAKDFYTTTGGGISGIGSMYVYDATNIRLAEVSLSYNLPIQKWCPFIKNAEVSLIGRNLLMFYSKAPYDPEATASTGTYFQGIDYFMQPSLKNLGFSVKLNF